MNTSIKEELLEHIFDLVKEGTLNRENTEDWQEIAFNQDYYIIGYHLAEQWIEWHSVSPFAVIEYVVDQHMDHFGECQLTPADFNAEKIVNLLVYFVGYELIGEHEQEIIEAAIQAEKS